MFDCFRRSQIDVCFFMATRDWTETGARKGDSLTSRLFWDRSKFQKFSKMYYYCLNKSSILSAIFGFSAKFCFDGCHSDVQEKNVEKTNMFSYRIQFWDFGALRGRDPWKNKTKNEKWREVKLPIVDAEFDAESIPHIHFARKTLDGLYGFGSAIAEWRRMDLDVIQLAAKWFWTNIRIAAFSRIVDESCGAITGRGDAIRRWN